jgi:hypothetical protein
MTRTAALLLLLAPLGACAPVPWTRADFSPAQAAQDEGACQEGAEREMSLRPAGFHGSLSQYYGPNYQPYGRTRWMGTPGPLFDIDPTARAFEQMRLEDECMRAKGYARRPTS